MGCTVRRHPLQRDVGAWHSHQSPLDVARNVGRKDMLLAFKRAHAGMLPVAGRSVVDEEGS